MIQESHERNLAMTPLNTENKRCSYLKRKARDR